MLQLQFIVKYLEPYLGLLEIIVCFVIQIVHAFHCSSLISTWLPSNIVIGSLYVLSYAGIETKRSWVHEINSRNNHQSGEKCNATAGRWKRRTIRMRKHATSTSSPTHGLRHLMMNCTWRVLCSEKYRAIYRRNL